ncbi:VapE domain-containing protein [Faecalibacter macacae]|uniref:Virulence-associated E family protein n=1 Tax=Faecalibacter macacae TaxID=1859289 RepID=A0A3L9M4D7_9FLAO|nr:VapE domain-containing protein [Faecalibacter macacae]RLZ08047.1 virulence-associated E family protein [Faecalibacter macacae]
MSQNYKSKSIFDQLEYYLNSKYEIRFNSIKLVYECSEISNSNFTELNIERLYVELERNDIKISFDKLLIYLKAFSTHYNPIKNYYHNLLPKWDGNDYIGSLTAKIKINDHQEYFNIQFKKFLVRTILCACEKKIVNKNAIIFYSPKQNIGKSTFIRYLCPSILEDYISENISNDKDSIIKIAKNLIINLDEMQNFMSKDLEFIKSLISKENINERMPYGRKAERIDRIASFLGSTNQTGILKDNSNVRWLVFEVDHFDFSYTTIDINKVWSQAYHLAYHGNTFNPFLTPEELKYNDSKNSKFRSFTREEEEIIAFVEHSENEEDFMTVTELCFELKKVFVNKNPIVLGRLLYNIGYKTTRIGEERTKKYKIKLSEYYYKYFRN